MSVLDCVFVLFLVFSLVHVATYINRFLAVKVLRIPELKYETLLKVKQSCCREREAGTTVDECCQYKMIQYRKDKG